MRINTKYKYEDQDILPILNIRLQQENLSNPSIIPFAPLDDINDNPITSANNQLVIHLQAERLQSNNQRILMVPYNLSGNHWVSIVIYYRNQNIIERVDYIDSLGGIIPENVENNLQFLFGSNVNIRKVEGLIQQDSTSCGALMIENMVRCISGNTSRVVFDDQAIINIRTQHQELLDMYQPELRFGERQENNIRSFSYEGQRQSIIDTEELTVEKEEEILEEDKKKINEMIRLCDQIMQDCSSNPNLLNLDGLTQALHRQSLLAFGELGYYEEAFNEVAKQSKESKESKESILSSYEEYLDEESEAEDEIYNSQLKILGLTSMKTDERDINSNLRKSCKISAKQMKKNIISSYPKRADKEREEDDELHHYWRETLKLTPVTRAADSRDIIDNLREICKISAGLSWKVKNNPRNKNIPWHHLEMFGDMMVSLTKHHELSNNIRPHAIIDIIQDNGHGLKSLQESLNNILTSNQNRIPAATLIKRFAGFFYDFDTTEDFYQRLRALQSSNLSDKVKKLSLLRLLQLAGEHLKRCILVASEGRMELYAIRDKLSKLGIRELRELLLFLEDPNKLTFLGINPQEAQGEFEKKFSGAITKISGLRSQNYTPKQLWQEIKNLNLATATKYEEKRYQAIADQQKEQSEKLDKKSKSSADKTPQEQLADQLVDKVIPYPVQEDGLDKVPKIQDQLKKILREVGSKIKSFEELKYRVGAMKLDSFDYEERYASQCSSEYKTLCEEIRKNRQGFSCNENLLSKKIKEITGDDKESGKKIREILNLNPNINKKDFEQELLKIGINYKKRKLDNKHLKGMVSKMRRLSLESSSFDSEEMDRMSEDLEKIEVQDNLAEEILALHKKQPELSKAFEEQKIELINRSAHLSAYKQIYDSLEECNKQIKQKEELLEQRIEQLVEGNKANKGKLTRYFESKDYSQEGLKNKLKELSIEAKDDNIAALFLIGKEVRQIKSEREKINIDHLFFEIKEEELKKVLTDRERLRERRNNFKNFLLKVKKIDKKDEHEYIEIEYNKFVNELKVLGIISNDCAYHQNNHGFLEEIFCKLAEIDIETSASKQKRRLDKIKLVYGLILELKNILNIPGHNIDAEITRENGFSESGVSEKHKQQLKCKCLKEATLGMHTITLMRENNPVYIAIQNDPALCQALEFLIIAIAQPILSELKNYPELLETNFDNTLLVRNYFSHTDARYEAPLIRGLKNIVVIDNPPKTVAQIVGELCVIYDLILSHTIQTMEININQVALTVPTDQLSSSNQQSQSPSARPKSPSASNQQDDNKQNSLG
jgi:hypothetical protein